MKKSDREPTPMPPPQWTDLEQAGIVDDHMIHSSRATRLLTSSYAVTDEAWNRRITEAVTAVIGHWSHKRADLEVPETFEMPMPRRRVNLKIQRRVQGRFYLLDDPMNEE